MKIKHLVFSFFFILSQSFGAQNQDYKVDIEQHYKKGLSFYYKNLDSLSHYFNKAKPIAYANDDIESLFLIYNYESWSAIYFGDFFKIKTNLKVLDSIINKYNTSFKLLEKKDYYKNQLLFTKGIYNYEIKKFSSSMSYFEKVIENCKKIPKSIFNKHFFYLHTNSIQYIADIHKQLNQYSLAKAYYNNNIRLIQENKLSNTNQLYSVFVNLATILQKEKNYKKSNKYLLTCIPYYKNVEKNNHRVVSGLHRVIENYLNLDKIDSAKFYLSKMKSEIKDDTHVMLERFNEVSSKLHEAEGNYKEALSFLKKNAVIQKKSEEKQKNTFDLSSTFNSLGNINLTFKFYNDALENFNLALDILEKNASKSTLTKTLEFKIIKNKIGILNILNKYQDVITTTDNAISILNTLRPSFKTEADKFFLQDNAFPIFENAIEASYKLYTQTNKKSYLKKAFSYFEKSKASLMLETLLGSKAEQFANVPEELLEKEKQLKAQINHLEKKLQLKSNIELENKVFNFKKEHNNLLKTIETDYKDFFNLKYNSSVLKLETLEDNIDNKTYLSFFFGNNYIYSLGVSKNTVNFNRIKLTKDVKNIINNYIEITQNPKSSIAEVNKLSTNIYTTILSTSLKNISVKNLIIIPDGLLNFIPFETLIKPNGKYLIEDTAVSYGLSATLLEKLKLKLTDNTNVLAFAPNFESNKTIEDSRAKLLPLVHTTKEVNNIFKFFKGHSFIGKKATLNNFKTNINNYGTIHLATHAILNDENPKYSYLAFSESDEGENLLFASDIYNTSLNTNMVTLSACETGVGNLKRGEGAISLARSFFYSGAASITSTLWKVNDGASANIMNYYYSNLANGQTKDKALQNAKKKYLKLNKDTKLAHPYYWSGFIASGNMQPLITTSNTLFWVASILILFTIIVFFIFLKRKKRN